MYPCFRTTSTSKGEPAGAYSSWIWAKGWKKCQIQHRQSAEVKIFRCTGFIKNNRRGLILILPYRRFHVHPFHQYDTRVKTQLGEPTGWSKNSVGMWDESSKGNEKLRFLLLACPTLPPKKKNSGRPVDLWPGHTSQQTAVECWKERKGALVPGMNGGGVDISHQEMSSCVWASRQL